MVPWSHEIDDSTLASAVLNEGSITFPLAGNDFLTEVTRADILYNLTSEEPFIYRVNAIDSTETDITFFVQDAPLTDLIIQAKIGLDEPSNMSTNALSQHQQSLNENGIGQLHQPLDDEFERITTTVSFPTIEASVCDNHSGVSVVVDLSASDIEGTYGSVDASTGFTAGDSCPDNTIGGRVSTTPTITIDIYNAVAALDIDTSWFGEESQASESECECFSSHYPDVAPCGISEQEMPFYKRECNGRLKVFNFQLSASFITALSDLVFELYYELEFSKPLFEITLVKVPFAIGPVPVTASVTFEVVFTAQTDGGLSASWAGKNAPGFQIDTMFGVEYSNNAFQRIQQDPQPDPYVIDDPDLLGKINASIALDANVKLKALILNFAGVTATVPGLYAKLEASYENNLTQGEEQCTLELSVGAAVKLGLESDAGWIGDLIGINGEVNWTILDTCDAAEGSFLRNLCYYKDFSAALGFVCPPPMPARVNKVRLTVDDANFPPGQNAPEHVPVDALFVQRVPVSSAPYYLVPSRVIVDGQESAEALEKIHAIQYLSCDPELWEESVITFENELIVDYAEVFEAGDLIRIHRQGFPTSQAADNPTNPEHHGLLCFPNGNFHIDVGRSDKEQWERLIDHVSTTSDHRLTPTFLESFTDEENTSTGN
ncbi:hypothetical protein DL240_06170 [Lujinxingia litoralis]|uniref:Uncharacterized protein n=1 Tax=Lujinxingia litoralis TaxID=2211119 RepID=A0A328CB82_9DELT|nr:hypothetical protein [Lujinxingia litoralis]RAL23739.1 hypothetical protein DL240_06170 [Lujinxingia litoralis]